jgi:hypothetical protein
VALYSYGSRLSLSSYRMHPALPPDHDLDFLEISILAAVPTEKPSESTRNPF